ncbi:MAG: class I SAM-dependent methyltransferase [bacterium]
MVEKNNKNNGGERFLFEGTAWYYAKYRPPYPQQVFRRLVERFHLDGIGNLVDLGCGTGELAIPLHQYFERVYAVDNDADMLNEGRKKDKELGATNIQWFEERAEDIVGNLGTFRLVVIGNAFHWMDRRLVLTKACNNLCSGGGIAIINGRSIWNGPEQWQALVVSIIKKWLGEERRTREGIYKPPQECFEDLLADFFPRVEKEILSYRYLWDINTLLGYLYSTSFCSRKLLGSSVENFEQDLRNTLISYNPSGTFEEEIPVSMVLAWK